MDRKYRKTLAASYLGLATQSIVNNLAPLLFVAFQTEFSITVAQIGFLVTFNFAVQLLVDFIAARYVDRVGYKKCLVLSQVCGAIGLIGLAVFPDLFGNAYAGLLAAIAIYAIGGGLVEVLVTPIVEALPNSQSSSAIPLLHSAYPWAHAILVILSTIYFQVFGTDNWRLLALFWSLIPLGNTFLCAISPIRQLNEDLEPIPVKNLFRKNLFWLLVILMVCSGAAEHSMVQWSSYFAETGLKVSKAMGDLIGPCLFAIFMGIARLLYGLKGDKLPIHKVLYCSGFLCMFSYALTVFSPFPVLSLVGCAICGISVALMWPGVCVLASRSCPEGGTAMFAYLALAGDLGCGAGPSVVGTISDIFGANLKTGLFAAILFPVVLVIGLHFLLKKIKDSI